MLLHGLHKQHLNAMAMSKKCWSLGGHWPRKGVWDVWHWRPPFHASPVVHKGPISNNSQKWEILASTTSIFAQILSLKSQNLKIFCSQDPHFRGNDQFASPHLGNPECTSLPEKKSWVPSHGTEAHWRGKKTEENRGWTELLWEASVKKCVLVVFLGAVIGTVLPWGGDWCKKRP